MKKYIVFAAAIFALSLTSCKKDYTCTCSFKDASSGSSTVIGSTTIHDTKSKAKSACEKTYDYGNGVTASCSL